MTRKLSAANAKAGLSRIVSDAVRGERTVIERHGKPQAAIVSIDDLEYLEQTRPDQGDARGALALVGAWRDLPNEDMDRLVEDIYAARDREPGRPVDLSA